MTLRLAFLVALVLVASAPVGDGIVALPDRWILLQMRLSRTLLAALVGVGVGLSGAVLQGALRNPLADPGLCGVTGIAGLGAALVFYWGWHRGSSRPCRSAGLRARQSGPSACSCSPSARHRDLR